MTNTVNIHNAMAALAKQWANEGLDGLKFEFVDVPDPQRIIKDFARDGFSQQDAEKHMHNYICFGAEPNLDCYDEAPWWEASRETNLSAIVQRMKEAILGVVDTYVIININTFCWEIEVYREQ